MKMITKQHLLRLSALALCLSLLLCNLPMNANAKTTEIGNENVGLDTKTMHFQKDQQLARESDFTITAKNIRVAFKSYIFVDLVIQNTGKHTLTFSGNGCQVNGYQVSTFFYKEVRPGKQADVSLYVDPLALAAVGIKQVDKFQIFFDVANKDTYEVLYGNYSLNIPVGATINMNFPASNKVVYKENAFTLTLLGTDGVTNRSAPTMVFLLENHLDGSLVVRNEGNMLMNDKECNNYISETANAYSNLVFAITPYDNFQEKVKGGGVAVYDFYLRICTGNWNPLVDSRLRLEITKAGKLKQSSITAAKTKAYQTGMAEYGKNPAAQGNPQNITGSQNMFVGMFRNYQPDPQYIATLKKKYPESEKRYYGSSITPYVNEILTLYLDKLDEVDFDFGVVEREDLCSESAYVVELTKNGQGIIQVAFTLSPTDPKAAHIITLGCSVNNFKNLDDLNTYVDAMWYAFDVLNVHMTPEKHKMMIQHSDVTTSQEDGVMLRGSSDGLGYVYSTSSESVYIIVTPDLSLPVFTSNSSGTAIKNPTEGVTNGSTFYFGSYEQDNDLTNGPEPIKWILLKREDDRVLAVSQQTLDAKCFNNTAGDIEWKDCTLRTWLNNDFYKTAFSIQEQSLLLDAEVDVTAGTDKVFLLSRHEAELHLPGSNTRLCSPTKYAVNQGAYANSSTGYCWWLLRTDGNQNGRVMNINTDGTVDHAGSRVQSPMGGIRPAVWIRTN